MMNGHTNMEVVRHGFGLYEGLGSPALGLRFIIVGLRLVLDCSELVQIVFGGACNTPKNQHDPISNQTKTIWTKNNLSETKADEPNPS